MEWGDHSSAVFPGTWDSSCHTTARHRLDSLARDHDFLGRHLIAVWFGQRLASGWLRARIWDLPSQPATPLTMADVLEGWQEHNSHILKSLKPGKDDALLLEQSAADATQGFCTPPTRPGILGVRAEQEQLGMTSVGWGSTILGGNPTGSALVSQACRL